MAAMQALNALDEFRPIKKKWVSKMDFYQLLFHVIACLWYIFFWTNFLTVYKQACTWNSIFHDIQDMGYRYLTNWNLFFQTIFFIGCLFDDVMKMLDGPNWLKFGSRFQTLMSLYFSSILLPLGIFVFISFWCLYAIDREFCYPKVIDTYIPFWHNHGMHTTILPLILLELFTTRHKFPAILVSLKIFLAFISVYGIVFTETIYEKGRWLYPMFEQFSLPISLSIIAVLILAQISCLFVGIFIQNVYWEKIKKNGFKSC